MLEERFDIRIVGFGTKSRHIQGGANIVVTCLGDMGFFIDTGAGAKMLGIEAGELDPLSVREFLGKQQQFAQQRDGAYPNKYQTSYKSTYKKRSYKKTAFPLIWAK